jgi:hypothetical protein
MTHLFADAITAPTYVSPSSAKYCTRVSHSATLSCALISAASELPTLVFASAIRSSKALRTLCNTSCSSDKPASSASWRISSSPRPNASATEEDEEEDEGRGEDDDDDDEGDCATLSPPLLPFDRALNPPPPPLLPFPDDFASAVWCFDGVVVW